MCRLSSSRPPGKLDSHGAPQSAIGTVLAELAFSVVTRSGSAEFHGSVSWFYEESSFPGDSGGKTGLARGDLEYFHDASLSFGGPLVGKGSLLASSSASRAGSRSSRTSSTSSTTTPPPLSTRVCTSSIRSRARARSRTSGVARSLSHAAQALPRSRFDIAELFEAAPRPERVLAPNESRSPRNPAKYDLTPAGPTRY